MLHNLTALNSCGVVSNMSLFFKVNHQIDCLKQNEWFLATREARVHLTLERETLAPKSPSEHRYQQALWPGPSDQSPSLAEFHRSSMR